MQISKQYLRQEQRHFNYIRSSVIQRLELWRSDYHRPVQPIAERRMNSCMKHILKLRNIYNKDENRYQM